MKTPVPFVPTVEIPDGISLVDGAVQLSKRLSPRSDGSSRCDAVIQVMVGVFALVAFHAVDLFDVHGRGSAPGRRRGCWKVVGEFRGFFDHRWNPLDRSDEILRSLGEGRRMEVSGNPKGDPSNNARVEICFSFLNEVRTDVAAHLRSMGVAEMQDCEEESEGYYDDPAPVAEEAPAEPVAAPPLVPSFDDLGLSVRPGGVDATMGSAVRFAAKRWSKWNVGRIDFDLLAVVDDVWFACSSFPTIMNALYDLGFRQEKGFQPHSAEGSARHCVSLFLERTEADGSSIRIHLFANGRPTVSNLDGRTILWPRTAIEETTLVGNMVEAVSAPICTECRSKPATVLPTDGTRWCDDCYHDAARETFDRIDASHSPADAVLVDSAPSGKARDIALSKDLAEKEATLSWQGDLNAQESASLAAIREIRQALEAIPLDGHPTDVEKEILAAFDLTDAGEIGRYSDIELVETAAQVADVWSGEDVTRIEVVALFSRRRAERRLELARAH